MQPSRGRPPVHGYTRGNHRSPTYHSWQSMIRRCSDGPSRPSYKYYAGRGITFTPAWRDFAVFIRDMGERPPGTTLDRINNEGNYEPDNCRWATPAQQVANSRRGDRRRPDSLMGKARAYGMPYSVVYQRVHILGWDVERALTTLIRPHVSNKLRRRLGREAAAARRAAATKPTLVTPPPLSTP